MKGVCSCAKINEWIGNEVEYYSIEGKNIRKN